MGWADAELSLTLVGDRAMARLNRETFGHRGPTNVIAFPLDGAAGAVRTVAAPGRKSTARRAPAAAGPPPLLGEVVISVATTVRQARESGWPWQELLDFFLIHGILHLLGYEHDHPAAAERMNAKTWELMGLLHPKLKNMD